MTPIEKAAYDIGAKGSEPREDERLAFEAWMRGHCWKVVGDWDGKQYFHAHESTGFVHGGAMGTRGLWAAWRDRGAVARVLAEQAQAVEPVAWAITASNTGRMCQVTLDHDEVADMNPKYVAPLYTHPAPPPAGEHVPETAFGNTERAELIAALIRKAEVWELWIPEAKRPNVCRETADMLEADAQEITRWQALAESNARLVDAVDQRHKRAQRLAQQVAVPATDAEKMDLVTNWFSEEWAVKSALGLLDDYEHHHGIKAKPAHTDWSAA